MSMIRAYGAAPKVLFRVNNGPNIRFRPWAAGLTSYDIYVSKAGKVLPKALDPATYHAPNGAPIKRNSPYQHKLLRMFKGDEAQVYILEKGIVLPGNLMLVHERADHWSMQPAHEMTLDALNDTMSMFLQTYCEAVTIQEWLRRYPRPTEFLRR